MSLHDPVENNSKQMLRLQSTLRKPHDEIKCCVSGTLNRPQCRSAGKHREATRLTRPDYTLHNYIVRRPCCCLWFSTSSRFDGAARVSCLCLCSSGELIAGRGCFRSGRASRQNGSRDIKAKCAVTESAACLCRGTVPEGGGDKHAGPSGEIFFLGEAKRRAQGSGRLSLLLTSALKSSFYIIDSISV